MTRLQIQRLVESEVRPTNGYVFNARLWEGYKVISDPYERDGYSWEVWGKGKKTMVNIITDATSH